MLEGLEGAAASAGTGFDRQKMEQTLAGLGSRVFLMNNVHEDGPVVFKTRWALSYLRGPVTRQQIEVLMAPWHAGAGATNGSATFGLPPKSGEAQESARPVLPPEIEEFFLPVRRGGDSITYRPALLGEARVHFVSAKYDIDRWEEVTLLRVVGAELSADVWEDSDEWDEDDLPELEREPEAEAKWGDLAADLTRKKSYSRWSTALRNHLYRHRRVGVFRCPALKEQSTADESESDFRIRLRHAAREARDLQIGKLRSKYTSKFRTLDDRVRRAEQKIEREKSQKREKTISAGVSILTSIAGALFGRKLGSAANVSRAGTAIRSAGRVSRESDDIRHAEETLQSLLEKREELDAEVEAEVRVIQDRFDPDLMELRQDEVRPRKSDLSVERLVLVWLPYTRDAEGDAVRAF